jgi:adenylate cyclase
MSWPWPREVYSAIIHFCQRNGARALAFDVLFTEPSKYGVADNQAFAAAIQDFKYFVGAVTLSQTAGSERRWPAFAPEPAFGVLGLEQWLADAGTGGLVFFRAAFPIPEISAVAGILGNVHMNPDRDSVYRRAALFQVFDGKVLPSLALGCDLAAQPGTPAEISKGRLSRRRNQRHPARQPAGQ